MGEGAVKSARDVRRIVAVGVPMNLPKVLLIVVVMVTRNWLGRAPGYDINTVSVLAV